MSEPFHFGHFSFDAASGTLLRQGAPVRLQPQPARVLAILLARAGDVVSREDLRQQIWPEGTYVDFERGLNFCIAQIRSALGDTATSPRYVETLPKRGYRFVAPVSRAEAGPQAALQPPVEAAPPLPVAPVPRGRFPARRGIVAALVAVVVVAVGAILWWGASRELVRVAVVSFDNET